MWGDLQEEPETGNNLIEMLPDGTIVGDIARNVVPADDNASITYHLREGMKWSDGHPLTADDFVFMFDDMHMHPEINTWGFRDYWKSIEKVDDHTLRIHFHGPHPEYFLNLLDFRGSGLVLFHPKHYLEKWHINHNPDANEVAKEEGFDDWLRAFEYHYWWHPTTDIDKPTTQPWRFKEFNHYPQAVRTEPLLPRGGSGQPAASVFRYRGDRDRAGSRTVPREDSLRWADLAFANTSIDNFSLYKQNEEAGGYTVTVIPGINARRRGTRSTSTIPTRGCARYTRTYAFAARCHWPSTATRSTRSPTRARCAAGGYPQPFHQLLQAGVGGGPSAYPLLPGRGRTSCWTRWG